MAVTHELISSEKPDEYRRVARVLEIVQFITARPGWWKRKTLAERYEISERQIQKDLDVIRHGLKLSLVHDGVGYSFDRMPKLPAVQYSFAEGLALLLAAQAAQQVSGIGSPDLAAAIARLQSIFPSEFSAMVSQVTGQSGPSGPRTHRQQMLLTLNPVTRRSVERAGGASLSHHALCAQLADDRLLRETPGCADVQSRPHRQRRSVARALHHPQ